MAAMSEIQSWQVQCPRCRWANSGAQMQCMKCGYPLPSRAGHLVAGSRLEARPQERVFQPAGVLPRLVAFIVDLIILGAVTFVIGIIWQATLPLNSSIKLDLELLWLYLGVFIVWAVYFIGFWSVLGGTPAMRIFNLQIVDTKGQPVSFGRSIMRFV